MKNILKILLIPLRILFLILSPFWGVAMIPVKIVNGLLYIGVGLQLMVVIFRIQKDLTTYDFAVFVLMLIGVIICQVILNLPNIIEYVYCSTSD